MMAEAPKSKKQDTPDPTGADKAASRAASAAKEGKQPVEDAVVLGETPAKKPATGTPATAASKPAKPTARPVAGAAEPAGKATRPEASEKTPEADRSPEPTKREAAGSKAPRTASTAEPATAATGPEASSKSPGERSGESSGKSSGSGSGGAGGSGPTHAAGAVDEPRKRRGGVAVFVGLLLGGAAAAIIGFVAARTIVPEGWPFPGVPPKEDPLAASVEAQGTRLATLEENLASLGADLDATKAAKADTAALEELRDELTGRLGALEVRVDGIAAAIAAIETRLSAVEKLAPEGSAAAEAAAEAYARELAALREMFAGELARIEAAQADAAALEAQVTQAAKAAQARAALARVQAALDTGAPFEEALAELAELTGKQPPEALAAVAASGAPTLAGLQDAFPAAARAAIDAATRAAVEDGSMSRVEAFLRTQLGTRSLAPKEGDDADAVLSRAEAALKAGDLAAALSELDGLPEAAKPALAEWRASAETRAAALAASMALAEELNAK